MTNSQLPTLRSHQLQRHGAWLLVFALASNAVACGGSTSEDSREAPNQPGTVIDEDSGASANSGTHTQTGSDAGGGVTKPGGDTGSAMPDTPAAGNSGGTAPMVGSSSPAEPKPGTVPPTMMEPPVSSPPIIIPPPSMTPAGSNIPDAENCQEPQIKQDETYCDATRQCDNNSIYATCKSDGTGNWSCYCGDNYHSISFNAPNGDASLCAATLDVCTPGAEPPTSASECSEPTNYSDSSYCSGQRSCNITSTLSDGSEIEIIEYQYTSCQLDSSGTILCSCNANGLSQVYELSNSSLDSSCMTTLDVCAQGIVPEFPTEAACETTYRTESESSCQYVEQCKHSVSVAEDIAIVSVETPGASCYDQGTGKWQCSCYNTDRSMNFELTEAQVGSGLCLNAFDLCDSFDEATVTEPGRCTRTSEYAGDGYCNAQVKCSNDLSFQDLDLTVIGYISTSCQKDLDGNFACMCAGSNSSVSHTISAEDEWDACERSSDICPDLVTGIVGSGSGIGRPMVGVPLSK